MFQVKGKALPVPCVELKIGEVGRALDSGHYVARVYTPNGDKLVDLEDPRVLLPYKTCVEKLPEGSVLTLAPQGGHFLRVKRSALSDVNGESALLCVNDLPVGEYAVIKKCPYDYWIGDHVLRAGEGKDAVVIFFKNNGSSLAQLDPGCFLGDNYQVELLPPGWVIEIEA